LGEVPDLALSSGNGAKKYDGGPPRLGG
jgi:hypothetical protein